MSFIQIGFLTALGALAIPILIHLVFRQKAKRVDLGTLRFLREVIEQNARRRRVMRWLLLALRLACVALLAVLFARPYWLSFKSAAEKQTVVVLIDRSATMELKSDGVRLVDRAVQEVQSTMATAPERTRFEIAFFDHRVHPLAEAQADAKKSKRELTRDEITGKLKAPDQCAGGTDFGAAIDWARDTLAKAPAGPRHLHVYTDLQQSGLAWSEVDELPDDVISHVHDLGRLAVNNIAVTDARAERVTVRPREQTTVHVTVYNGSPFSAENLPVVLKLAHDKQKIELKDNAKLEAGASESLRFDLPPLDEGLWQGTVEVQTEDDLAVDNKRHVAILAAKPYQVLLIDGRSAASSRLAATYFLEAALRLAPQGELDAAAVYEPRVITADEILPALDKFDVVVMADVGEFDRSDAQRVAKFVEQGGGLILFGGENVTKEKTRSLADAGLIPGEILGTVQATDLPLRLSAWDTKHPVFAAFGDPQLGDLARLTCSACVNLKPADDASVLATFRDKRPAVVARERGKGSILWLATSADRQWSDWPRSRLYLPLVHQLLGWQTGVSAGGRVRTAILEGNFASAAMVEDEAPGVHERDGYSLVVNTSPRESETDRGTVEEFAKRFGLKLAAENADAPATTVTAGVVGTELMDSEIWPILACALLALLMVEVLVANRTAA
jgi:hypothetical protein